MSAEAQKQFAQRETAALQVALGPNAEERIKAASDSLSKMSGRELDIGAIVGSNGASVGLILLNQAEVLAASKH